MSDDVQNGASLIAHCDGTLFRLARRIERLRNDMVGPEWSAIAEKMIQRYEAEITITRAKMDRLMGEHRPERVA